MFKAPLSQLCGRLSLQKIATKIPSSEGVMKNRLSLLALLILPFSLRAQGNITYQLSYSAPGDSTVHVSLLLSEPMAAPLSLVMPRTYPGGYEQIPYDAYIEHVRAFTADQRSLAVEREADGPRWKISGETEPVARIEYEVNAARMEDRTVSSVETSKVRPGYAGLLGYSIFAYIDGLETRPINLRITVPPAWPVLTTLAPEVPAPLAKAEATVPNYYALADSEILMGPQLQLRKFPGKIPLILAVYAETEEDLAQEGQLAREALDRVQSYFGDVPFQQYTVQLELLRPVQDHDYGFSQEHIDSGTFSLSVDRAITAQSARQAREVNLFNYAHHMAHSWIPKRAYGPGYLPFTWEMTPVLDTIWFNEGFGRYAAIEALAAGMPHDEAAAFRTRQLSRLREILDTAPRLIRKMPLDVLSREASFLYGTDFRTGMNIFARGALMAADMDDRIREKTAGKKSLRDALQSLVVWCGKNQRGFETKEMMEVIQVSTGVDVSDILQRWSRPQAP
jgi:predicted metalloprotease with PDZ domain